MASVVSLRAVLLMYLGTVLVPLSDSALLMRVHEYEMRDVTLTEVQEQLECYATLGKLCKQTEDIF